GPSARAARPVSRRHTELSASGRADVPLGEGGRPWIRRSSHGLWPLSCSAAPYLPAPSNWPGKVALLDPQRPRRTIILTRSPMNSHAARYSALKLPTIPPARLFG